MGKKVREPGSRTYGNYSKRQLQQALTAINERSMTLSQASKVFKICKGTLSNAKNDKHNKKPGRPFGLPEGFENNLVKGIIKCSDWGFPLNRLDVRKIVQTYLNKQKIKNKTFKNNMPGPDWVRAFIDRHSELSECFANHIKRSRAQVGTEVLKEYHGILTNYLGGLESNQVFNYNETNLADNPGRKKSLQKRNKVS